MLTFKTQGVCARQIELEIVDGKINYVNFMGGCDGNLKGICQLIVGRDALEVAELLEGTRCGMKRTSCPDQLAIAIHQHLGQ